MLTIGEPNRTPYDLNFGLLGFPIRIHPLFWLAALIWGFRPDVDGISIMIWVTVMLVSILVHELGHALMMRKLGRHARVVLHFMGGLAIEDDKRSPWALNYGQQSRTPQEQIWISIAGPAAGFLLAGLVWGAVLATGGSVEIHFSADSVPYCLATLGGDLERNDYLNQFVGDMLYINIFWGVVNLFPVIPLDGGQIAQAWFTAQDPMQGIVKALWLSVITGAAAAIVFGVLMHEMFLLLLFASLAFSCYMTLQQFQGRGPRGW